MTRKNPAAVALGKRRGQKYTDAELSEQAKAGAATRLKGKSKRERSAMMRALIEKRWRKEEVSA